MKKIIYASIKRNGLNQLFFYLSNLDVYRIIVFDNVIKYFQLLNGDTNKTVLELGSGYSILPKMLSGRNINYITLDLSKDAALYQRDKGISPIIGDMQHLPFKKSKISIVIAISSIEHVPKDSLVFNEIGRVLEKSGIAILSYPYSSKKYDILNHEQTNKMLFFIFDKFDKVWNLILNSHHIKYFKEQSCTDYMMRIYTDGYIDSILVELQSYKKFKWGGDTFFKRFWSLVPPGWFVLKDFLFVYILYKFGRLENNINPSGIINIMIKK